MLAAPYFKFTYAYFAPPAERALHPAGGNTSALPSPVRMLRLYKKQHKDYIRAALNKHLFVSAAQYSNGNYAV